MRLEDVVLHGYFVSRFENCTQEVAIWREERLLAKVSNERLRSGVIEFRKVVGALNDDGCQLFIAVSHMSLLGLRLLDVRDAGHPFDVALRLLLVDEVARGIVSGRWVSQSILLLLLLN